MKSLALIGVGRWGKNIVSTLEKIPGSNLKYLCADDKESLAPYAKKYEIMLDWRDLLKKKDVGAVFIATPAKTHAEIAAGFLTRNIAVFTEKPMTVNISEAKRLKMLVKKTGSVFMVGYQYVYNGYVNFIKKEIEAGSFGKILAVESEQALIPPRQDIDVFWDAGPHPLSIFQYLFNPAHLLSAEGKIAHDSALVHVTFENTPKLEIAASYFGAKKTRKLTIVGEKAAAILDETLEKNKLAIVKNGKTVRPEIDAGESLKNELEHFLRCVQTGETPRTNVAFGSTITEWLEIISKKIK